MKKIGLSLLACTFLGLSNANANEVVVTAEDAGVPTEVTILNKAGNASEFTLLPKSLSSVCKSVRGIAKNEVWKAGSSAHIRSDGRVGGVSFIVRRGGQRVSARTINVYNSAGTVVQTLSAYTPAGASYASRHYSGWGRSPRTTPRALAAKAMVGTNSPTVFVNNATGQCVRIPNPAKCYNSSGC